MPDAGQIFRSLFGNTGIVGQVGYLSFRNEQRSSGSLGRVMEAMAISYVYTFNLWKFGSTLLLRQVNLTPPELRFISRPSVGQ